MYNFDNSKKSILGKEDKSSIGEVDSRIVGLCDVVNGRDDMFTTSSCSGRVVLIRDSDKKESGLFLFRSHELISFEELKREIERVAGEVSSGMVMFKQEPCLLVVSCKDDGVMDWLFGIARNNGWKKSGVLGGKKRLVELMSSGSLEFPVAKDGRVLVDDSFLKVVVERANRNLVRSWERIGGLKGMIEG
ncbi:hypothetical protein CMI38_05260 [Candidatus Pacearchaeota archaeon]|jgi:tRNA wybutosine-synthesizing protein 3|nr:hypothetical protein [Candidatus Pacearchaeota archaeon]|tara:strand:+ start:942 stop:1511 length:570 start_codon:yes stop_codon:yes gene_type:complete